MSINSDVLLCFKRPKKGGYIGGLVTLCNDYINKSDIFIENNINLSCFNYDFPTGSFASRLHNSKISNLLYGYLQGKALKKILKEKPNTTIHIHTSRKALFFKDVILAKRIRKHCKGKILMTVHVGDISTVFHNERTKRYLIGLLNKSVDKVLFLSKNMRQQFIDAGLEEKRAEVLYNFFNIHRLAPNDKEQSPSQRLLYLGSINKEKGIIEMLQAAAGIKDDFHLDVCGSIIEEPIRKEFEDLLKRLGSKVTYHGYIGKEKKEELLRACDILILPSYREGLPISILEAMATSCGIITTPVGAIPEILSSENAIIVEPRSTQKLQSAIQTLLDDRDMLQEMKQNNYTASESFLDVTHIKQLCQLYKQ